MKTQLCKLNYDGFPITFEKSDDDVMVNATEMGRRFNKRPVDWLKTQHAREFIKALACVRNCTHDDLVTIKFGSPTNGGGSWFHRDVAIEYARDLKPAFGIWCNDRIMELLSTGHTSMTRNTQPDPLMVEMGQVFTQFGNVMVLMMDSMKQTNTLIQSMMNRIGQYDSAINNAPQFEPKQRRIHERPKTKYKWMPSNVVDRVDDIYSADEIFDRDRNFGEFCGLMHDCGYVVTVGSLLKMLRTEYYLRHNEPDRNMPSAKSERCEYFHVNYDYPEPTVMITPRGQRLFYKKITGRSLPKPTAMRSQYENNTIAS